ncbi:hypothetical protein BK670_15000 [Pseudomonas fluorescens]|uniref:Uncharacterized protein n=1 Tax=Pseudomonas fluorescens TaxID=294 RepID=A0A423ME67_PSEFL|nr:hypothetical protein BK670_15000 [Pseudomonas fluorescens]
MKMAGSSIQTGGLSGRIMPLNIRMDVLFGKTELNSYRMEVLNIPMALRTMQKATLFRSN